MKIQHMLWQKAPYEEKELIEIGSAFWKINARSHGDYEDNFVTVFGYFCYYSTKDGFRFVQNGVSGRVVEEVEPHRVDSYGEIVD